MNTRIKLLAFLLLLACSTVYGQSSILDRATAIGEKMDEALITEDQEYLNGLFDKKAFTKSIIIDSDDQAVKGFNEGFLSGFDQPLAFFNLIFGQVQAQGDELSFVRAYVKNGTPHILFRIYGNGGRNYHDYELKEIDGQLKIIDLYIYIAGENLTETIRRFYLIAKKSGAGSLGNGNN